MTAERIARRFLAEKDVPDTIAVDFDGALHSFKRPWTKASEILDSPVPGALEAVEAWIAAKYQVVVSTSRANEPGGAEAVKAWLKENGFPDLEVVPKVKAILYVDDRGFRFKGEWPSVTEIQALRTPWTKKK